MLSRSSTKVSLTTAATVTILAMLATAAITTVASGHTQPTSRQKPNIVFVLTDDMDSGLLDFMPQARKLRADGVSFSNYSVTNSLCCPSRASIFTGRYPHNSHVYTNNPEDGGFTAFQRGNLEQSTFGVELQERGYRTAMMGKYLNGYLAAGARPGRAHVPAGWDRWVVPGGDGHRAYGYTLNQNGWLVKHGRQRFDYLTDVLAAEGTDFIQESVRAGDPFMLEVATFAPHDPSIPAPRDKRKFPKLTAPRDPSFNEPDMSDKPRWIRQMPRLSRGDVARINQDYRRRARSLQAVDRMLGRLRATLTKVGEADNTYVFFSSDNGYHLGQHRLLSGKKTAYSPDVEVPLIAAGPGIPANRTRPQIAENVDLNATFTDIGAAPSNGTDGRSLLPILRGRAVPGWKTAALVEHRGPNNDRSDPDYQATRNANPPTYNAIRTARTTYVEYETGEREYYDRRHDPFELTNTYDSLSRAKRRQLHRRLHALQTCRGASACSTAAGGR